MTNDRIFQRQLQEQLFQLKREIAQTQVQTQGNYQQLMNLVYSGGSKDENGNPLPNPTIYSKRVVVQHGEEQEILMQVGPASANNWWQSLTFSGEYCMLGPGQVITQRMDYTKNLFADFDYRYANVYTSTDSGQADSASLYFQLMERFKIIYPDQLATLESYLTDNQKLTLMVFSEADYAGRRAFAGTIFSMFNYGTAPLLQMDGAAAAGEFTMNYLLQYIHAYYFMLELTTTRVQNQGRYKYINPEDPPEIWDGPVVENVLEHAIQNVYISNNTQFYVDPAGEYYNVSIFDSTNLQIYDCSNTSIVSCNKIFIANQSLNQGQIIFRYVSGISCGQNFAENGASIVITRAETDTDVLEAYRFGTGSCTGANIIINGPRKSAFIFNQNSLQYSSMVITDADSSFALFSDGSCCQSQINLNSALINRRLFVGKDALYGGLLQIDKQSDDVKYPIGFDFSSIFVPDCLTPDLSQSLSLPVQLQLYYQEVFAQKIQLYNTKICIKNTCKTDDVYDNGPFDWANLNQNYMCFSYVCTYPVQAVHVEGKSDYWLGQVLADPDKQIYLAWGYLQI